MYTDKETKKAMWLIKNKADFNTSGLSTGLSKKPFQLSMWLVNNQGFIALKKGISIVVKMVQTMITLIAAMIGPIEFSAKTENKKASAATVIMERAAKL